MSRTPRCLAAMAAFVALALFALARIRHVTTATLRDRSATSTVTVTALDETELSEPAQVLADAFATEAFTTTAFADAISQVEDEYERAVGLLLRAHVDAGQPVFTVTSDGDVVGVAAITRPGVSSALVRIVWRFTRELPVVVRLLGRLDSAGVSHIARTIRPPEGLPSTYYRLEAIGVAPDAQGRGVGQVLLDAIHDLVEHDPGASGIYLYTGEKSTRNWYERSGYVPVGTKQSNEVVAYHMFRPNEHGQETPRQNTSRTSRK